MKALNPKKVLILGNMGIGNLIMFIPTIKAFRTHFPKALFFLVTDKNHLVSFKEILHQFRLIDEFIVFDGRKANLKERIKYIEKIKKERFDMVIKNFLVGINFMTGLLKVKYRIGHVSSPDFPIRGDFIFNYPVQMGKNEHEILRNLRLFYAIESKKKIESTHELPFQLEIPKTIQQKVDCIIRKPKTENRKPIIAMQIGTSALGDWKEWSHLKFADLVKELSRRYNIKIVLLGDSEALKKGKIIEERARTSCINLVGKTSIMEAAAIIKKCNVLISNDASLMWVAQAVGTPVVAIYGPTDYRRTGPIGIRDKIIRKDLQCSPCYKSPIDYKKAAKCRNKKCLKLITSQEVLDTVVGFL